MPQAAGKWRHRVGVGGLPHTARIEPGPARHMVRGRRPERFIELKYVHEHTEFHGTMMSSVSAFREG